VYFVIGLPPSEVGGDQVSATCRSPGTSVSRAGAPGTVRGVTAVDGADAGPFPLALLAKTVNT
jgi:hypothetical protein